MKKHNFRKGLLAASALVLVAAISVGLTLAYLTDATQQAENVFTAGDGITIDLKEPSYKGEQNTQMNVQPGETFDKDPTVVNTTEESGVYVIARVIYKINDVQVSYDRFVNSSNDGSVKNYATIINAEGSNGFNTEWTKMTASTGMADYFVYGSKDSLTLVEAKNDNDSDDTVPLFNKVAISTTDEGGNTYDIVVHAFAVNAVTGTSSTDSAEALADLKSLVKTTDNVELS